MQIQIMLFQQMEFRCSPHACVDLFPPTVSVWWTGSTPALKIAAMGSHLWNLNGTWIYTSADLVLQ